jgi:hypothetical protein
MANSKISGLTTATTPLAGTEELALLQTSDRRITVANFAAGAVKSNATTGVLQVVGPVAASTRVMTTPDANFTIARTDAAQTFTGGQTFATTISVGGATPSASGAGITFPATQSASSNANTLDDYEEGTWTVGLTAGTSGTITAFSASGSYTKIGRQVTVSGFITIASVSSPVGLLRMTGLPFANGGPRNAVSIWPHSLTASAVTGVVGFVEASESTVVLYVYTAGNGAVDMASYIQGGSNLCVSVTYFV